MRAGAFGDAFAVSDEVLSARDPATRDDPAAPYHVRWVWDGRPFDGRRVLVRCYHGLGDTLQFARYLAPLRRRAAHVTLEVQAPLLTLLGGMPGVDALVGFDPARPLPPSECDIEIMELAHALRLAPDATATPLLHVEGEAQGGIGFCWRAGGWDPGRDLVAAVLTPLVAQAGAGGISLQRGPAAREAAALGLRDPLDGDMDLGRTARLIAGLDAVVTVDTMVAHLAASLGRPTLVLLKHDPDWRWGLGARTAWYRTVRTVRQARAGDWAGVMAQAAATLAGAGGS